MEGLKFRRQHAIGRFIVDFFCAELRLVMELDGGVHTGAERAEYDLARTAWLEAHGYRVVRLRNEDVTAATCGRWSKNLAAVHPLRVAERGTGGEAYGSLTDTPIW
jgi:very-short-patch-repair endonuclease